MERTPQRILSAAHNAAYVSIVETEFQLARMTRLPVSECCRRSLACVPLRHSRRPCVIPAPSVITAALPSFPRKRESRPSALVRGRNATLNPFRVTAVKLRAYNTARTNAAPRPVTAADRGTHE